MLEDPLEQLRQQAHVTIESTQDLAWRVERAAHKVAEKRAEEEKEAVPRKPALTPLSPALHHRGMVATPWELLHTLGRATVLAGQTPSRGLSQHWNYLRYLTTLQADHHGRMELSANGKLQRYHRKTVQAQDLGAAFALRAAREILSRQHPGHHFEVVDAEVALEAGWALRGKESKGRYLTQTRPGYFLIGKKPGSPLRLVVVECRGTHGKAGMQHDQLARAAERVQAFALDGAPAPSLLMSTALAGDGGIGLGLLDPPGDGVLQEPGAGLPDPTGPAEQLNLFPQIPQVMEDDTAGTRPGFNVRAVDYEWFSRVLVRTAAAAVLTFVGDRESAAHYLTPRQQIRLGDDYSQHATNAECDVRVDLGGVELVGTDHVFRLDRRRVEVFSGIPEVLHTLLARDKDLGSYLVEAPRMFARWAGCSAAAEEDWGGVVSMDGDGTVLALRWLGEGRRELRST
ncbi:MULTISPECIES: hypothetical protein [unclassified Amycolatopsis]|uniref:hypothetical protein n=1 Tax=unclassified Amycolatopsis TaxID=2618356 RepID=UPI0028767A39|nr:MULTISPECIES: hypothetical protein [unclassified Amycolatopsis]MDS0137271.1 hypothetical protein [Amycolatopsis sp. 505]MDS0141466.1 hypothetical protein [Amycolatopsis sp. CM201R]